MQEVENGVEEEEEEEEEDKEEGKKDEEDELELLDEEDEWKTRRTAKGRELTKILCRSLLMVLPGKKGGHRSYKGYVKQTDEKLSWGGLLRQYYHTKSKHGFVLHCCMKYFYSSTYAREHLASHIRDGSTFKLRLEHSQDIPPKE